MSKEEEIRNILVKRIHESKTKQIGSKKSLFNNTDYDFDNSVKDGKLSKHDKTYIGLQHEDDDFSFEDTYHGSGKVESKKNVAINPKSFFDDDEEFIEKSHEKFVMTESLPSVPIPAVTYIAGQKNTSPNKDSPVTVVEETSNKIDRALAIAEDFIKYEALAVIGGALYRYNGEFYALLSANEAQRLIFKNYRKEVSQPGTVQVLRNATILLKLSADKVYEEFPINKEIIIFKNGTLDVNTGRCRPNSPDDMANSALGISYHPKAWEMPYTKRFLKTISGGDEDLYERILQCFGYILSNDLSAKSFFYLQGLGDTGKSLFCALIASFFPEIGANKVSRIALQNLGDRFALGNLVNTKLNISEDLPDNPLSPNTISKIKMISDANRLEAEAKYVQPFSFKPICKLLFASNHPLRLKEYDEAFRNRVVFIPFNYVIPKKYQDKDLLQKMREELPALFNRAFQSYKRLKGNNYIWAGAGRIEPEITVANSGISFEKEDIVRRFIRDCCDFAENTITATEDLKYAYDKYCRENNYLPIAGDRFSRELSALLTDTVERVKIGNQRRGYKGIRLKECI